MPNRLVLELTNQIGEITRMGEAVESFCGENGCPMTTVFEINLALDELVTNIISYGFPKANELVLPGVKEIHSAAGNPPNQPWIKIEMELNEDIMTILLSDNGAAFNPLQHQFQDQSDVKLEDRKIGGLGIHLVTHYMDDVRYQRVGDCNLMTLIKRIVKQGE